MWPLTKRDYLIGFGLFAAAICVLVAIVYAVARIVNYWFPVGCVQ